MIQRRFAGLVSGLGAVAICIAILIDFAAKSEYARSREKYFQVKSTSELRFIEDDIVDALGTFTDLRTFQNAFKMDMTYPLIQASEIRLSPQQNATH
jgi:hypothetical protein